MEAVYGSKTDTIGYLNRFFDYKIRLPEPKSQDVVTNEFTTDNELIYGGKTGLQQNLVRFFLHCITDLVEAHNLSIRSIMQYSKYIQLLIRNENENTLDPENMQKLITYSFFIILKIFEPHVYDQINVDRSSYLSFSRYELILKSSDNKTIKRITLSNDSTQFDQYLKDMAIYFKRADHILLGKISDSNHGLRISQNGTGYELESMEEFRKLRNLLGIDSNTFYQYHTEGLSVMDFINKKIEFYSHLETT